MNLGQVLAAIRRYPLVVICSVLVVGLGIASYYLWQQQQELATGHDSVRRNGEDVLLSLSSLPRVSSELATVKEAVDFIDANLIREGDLAENLGYTQEELEACEKSLPALKKFFLANKYSTNKDIINAFRNRSVHLNPRLPGAIGYFIGYKIVEAYVQKHGPKSWKDVFIKSPGEIYEESGFGEE